MHRVDSLTRDSDSWQVTLSEGRRISARALILATSAACRRFGLPMLREPGTRSSTSVLALGSPQ